MNVAFYTLGCKLNFAESSTIGKQFLSEGYKIIDFDEKADVYVINTCTVTETANKECRQVIRRARRRNPNAFVIVTGCYAQLKPNEIALIEGVDLVLGSNEKFKLFDYFKKLEKTIVPSICVSEIAGISDFGFAFSSESDSRTRAFFKIQDGCDYKCTYCTIPLARGNSRSPFINELKGQFVSIINNGYKEIILTGVNVGEFKDPEGNDFYSALKEIVSIEGDFRLRISSIEPNLVSEKIIELIAVSDKICKHLHIPLQSGSNKILSLMKRRYRREVFEKLILTLDKIVPDIGLGIDVIAGFPGESEADFLDTYNFIKDLPISYLHAFTYSERENTPAAGFDGSVSLEERRRRTNMLRILGEKKKEAFHNKLIGTEAIVLFEQSERQGLIKGFTSNYVRVGVPFSNELINEFAKVTLLSHSDNLFSCEIKGIKK